MVLNLLYKHKCPADSSQNSLITDNTRGEVFCKSCGLVVAEKMVDSIHSSPTYSKEQYLNQTRAEGESKLSFHDMGVSGKIAFSGRDASGNSLSSKTKQKFKRLRTWDSRSKKTTRERNMVSAFTLLDSMKSKLGLSESIREKAAYLYRKAMEERLIRGRSIPSILSASVYAACREADVPRSLDDIAHVANIRKKVLSGAYRHLIKNLGIDFMPHDPKNYVNRIASQVGANEKSKRLAWKILDAAKKHRLTYGKKPMGIAGASVYLAAAINNQRITYSQISESTNISTVTLRKLVKIFAKKLSGIEELDGVTL